MMRFLCKNTPNCKSYIDICDGNGDDILGMHTGYYCQKCLNNELNKKENEMIEKFENNNIKIIKLSKSNICWLNLLHKKCIEMNDNFSKMTTTLTLGELIREFSDEFGTIEGSPFTAWTDNYVYFPWQYDGSEGVAVVPRNPCDKVTFHIGGS